MGDTKNKHIYQIIITVCLIALMIILSFIELPLWIELEDQVAVKNILIRFIGGFIVIYWMIIFGYKSLLKFKNIGKSLYIMIPAFIISINNFPIIAYFDDRAVLTEPLYRVFLFILTCLSVGFFEEIIFRGVVLTFLLRTFLKHKNNMLISIIFSSLIFAFSHIFNLFEGASFGDTFLQIGYSFLVGMLWAVMFLKTKNIWLTMLLHASFNFFGQVMFMLGDVNYRYDPYTIGITLVLSISVGLYTFSIYKKISDTDFMHINT